MALTQKNRLFVDEYIIDLNATQAAIRAGYSPNTAGSQGERLLRKAEIQSAIQESMNERSQRTAVTADYVLSGILETIERCRQAEPVLDRQGRPVMVETPNGEEAPAYTFDAKNVLRGYELLGKHLRLFTDKDELDLKLKRLDIEKRKAEIERLKAGDDPEGAAPVRVEVTVKDARKPDA